MASRKSMGTKLSPPKQRAEVWNKLFFPHIEKAALVSHPLWMGYLPFLPLHEEPHIEDMILPGWRFVHVEGKVSEDRFWSMLSKSVFPINIQLRHLSELEYCVLRDTFHDTVGHVPPLYSVKYSHTMRYMGILGVRAFQTKNKEAQKVLSRIYWATIEFSGMLDGIGEVRPLGAGIVSSSGELEHFFSETHKHRGYDLESIEKWEYGVEGFQDRYYIIESWDQVDSLLDEFVKKYF